MGWHRPSLEEAGCTIDFILLAALGWGLQTTCQESSGGPEDGQARCVWGKAAGSVGTPDDICLLRNLQVEAVDQMGFVHLLIHSAVTKCQLYIWLAAGLEENNPLRALFHLEDLGSGNYAPLTAEAA